MVSMRALTAALAAGAVSAFNFPLQHRHLAVSGRRAPAAAAAGRIAPFAAVADGDHGDGAMLAAASAVEEELALSLEDALLPGPGEGGRRSEGTTKRKVAVMLVSQPGLL